MVDSIFILYLVGILFAFLADFSKVHVLWIFSGVWFLGNSVNLAFTNQGFVSPLFFALSGVIMIFVSVQRFWVEYKLDTEKQEADYYAERELKV